MIISQTPLRLSLCGGGTDFKGFYQKREGFVVSCAINKYVYVIIKERFDDLIYVNYTKKEIVKSIDELQHELVREAAKKANVQNGFEVTMLSDIPSEGSGLGSSSSITVGLLNAFYQYSGVQVSAEQLASEACEIEIEILGKPIGKQDQYIAAFGGIKAITFKADESVLVESLKASSDIKRKLISNLLLFYTNITRQASSILTEQKARIDETVDFLDAIKKLGYDAKKAIEEGDVDLIGELLAVNWEKKKNLSSNISNPEIDEMYNRAIDGGAIGGKIAGAGGGGFLMTYCQRKNQDELREALGNFRELPFMYEPFGSRIIFNIGVNTSK